MTKGILMKKVSTEPCTIVSAAKGLIFAASILPLGMASIPALANGIQMLPPVTEVTKTTTNPTPCPPGGVTKHFNMGRNKSHLLHFQGNGFGGQCRGRDNVAKFIPRSKSKNRCHKYARRHNRTGAFVTNTRHGQVNSTTGHLEY